MHTLGGNGLTREYGLASLITAARVARIAPVSREMILNFVSHQTPGPAQVVLSAQGWLAPPGRRPARTFHGSPPASTLTHAVPYAARQADRKEPPWSSTASTPTSPPVELPIHDAVLGRPPCPGSTPALVDGVDGTTVTYARLDAFHRRIAAALAEAGVRKGDVRRPAQPQHRRLPGRVLRRHPRGRGGHHRPSARHARRSSPGSCADCGARWIVTVSPLLDTARRAAQWPGGVAEIFVCDRAAGPPLPPRPAASDTAPGAAGTAPPLPLIDPAADLAALPYSSGTTGIPKGVMLTHRTIATNLAQLDPADPQRPRRPDAGRAARSSTSTGSPP